MVLVKVDGAGENDIIPATAGQDIKLRCFAIGKLMSDKFLFVANPGELCCVQNEVGLVFA